MQLPMMSQEEHLMRHLRFVDQTTRAFLPLINNCDGNCRKKALRLRRTFIYISAASHVFSSPIST